MFHAKRYLQNFFNELFVKKDLSCLDRYLDPGYFDYDIGPAVDDHIQNSKDYILEAYKTDPTRHVVVREVRKVERAYCAHLVWRYSENGVEKTRFEGVATFVIENGRIKRRSTLMFEQSRE